MADEQQGPVHSAALMVGARMANLAIGLVAIPVLIRYLGGSGFAAWAILLALGAAFSMLELGMGPTAVRFLALPVAAGQWNEVRQIFGRIWLFLFITFGAGLPLALAFAPPFAAWTGLPDSGLLSAQEAIFLVFGCVAARAVLQSGVLSMVAGRRFVAASAFSLLQPLCSNIAAMVVAWQYGRLDLTLIAYWTAQLGVLAGAFFFTRTACLPSFSRATFDIRRLREIGYYGVTNQMEGWAQFVNFQFDKFIVAGLVGLWAVAPYEVANRAVAALRSLPASGAETFLPAAMAHHADREAAWRWYVSSTNIAAYGVIVFMLAPLAVAPVFLYAWTGQMGYVGRWVFAALSVGAMASVLALPAGTLLQAASRPDLPARAALLSIVANVALSLWLVMHWELVGAAVGTGIAMVAAAAQLVHAAHRHAGRPMGPTLRMLARFWAPALVCLCWGALTYVFFQTWIDAIDPLVRFSRATRVYPAAVAVGVYALIVGTVLVVELLRGEFPAERRRLLGRALGLERLADMLRR